MTDYLSEYTKWTISPIFDEKTKTELKNITCESEIKDRFYKELEFGTGGLRGIIGAGTNRMNVYTVGKATQGLANFINSVTAKASVVIAYDSRKFSQDFAMRAALVLCANGIKVHIFKSLRATPQLSFAVRYLKATAGIVITASHNPPNYNGYKVYWSDGGQIVPPYDKLIISAVNKVGDYCNVKVADIKKAKSCGLLNYIKKEVDNKFIEAAKSTVINYKTVKNAAKNIKIVYTPLNGAGGAPVTKILKKLGFKKLWVVPEQAMPDGNFSTLKSPNPEEESAYEYALKLAKNKDADLIFATDPDADRLGVYAKDKNGNFLPFTGNMIGELIAEYILYQKSKNGALSQNLKDAAIVTTIVSSKMAKAIAAQYGVTHIEVLTGFKYIGEQIKLFELAKKQNGGKSCAKKYAYNFTFGFEESYGYLTSTYVRDKDAISAVAALCEVAAYYHIKGLTLCDAMKNLYKKYGYYKEGLNSVTLHGIKGAQKIKSVLQNLRENCPQNIGEFAVIKVSDYKNSVTKNLKCGTKTKITLPQSDVLYFELLNDCWCCIRPSGTEPKIKLYYGVKANSEALALELLNKLKNGIMQIIGEKSNA